MKKGERGAKRIRNVDKRIFLGLFIIIIAFGALFVVYKLSAKEGLAGKAFVALGAVTEMPHTFLDLEGGNNYGFTYNGKSYTLVMGSVSDDKTSVGFGLVKGDVIKGEPEICDDRKDNDGDTYIDCDDGDCNGKEGTVGRLTIAICEWRKELTCDDNFDNDADTYIDCDDGDCNGKEGTVGRLTCEWRKELTCDDDFDNDADGLKDCADGDCAADVACI